MNLTHIESRPSKTNPGIEYGFFVDCDCSSEGVKEQLLERLQSCVTSIAVVPKDSNSTADRCTIHVYTHH